MGGSAENCGHAVNDFRKICGILKSNDAIFIFSVGSSSAEKNSNASLVHAIDCANQVGAGIFGVVSKDGV